MVETGNPLVAVVMSVFNGSAYLREQIESILSQQGVSISLHIWDDGSTDDTPNILRSYSDRITWNTGPNLGAAQGFLQAVQLCDAQADFYAFSDADDVWMPDKVITAVSELQAAVPSGPALIATRLTLTDTDLNPIGLTPTPAVPFSFENALVQGGIGGASCVLNRDMWNIFRAERPRNLVMHDGWLYVVATAFGTVVYSPSSKMLYRQHGRNVMGAAHTPYAQWIRRLRTFIRKGDGQKDQAVEFLRLYGEKLSPAKRTTAENFVSHTASPFSRFLFLFRPGVKFNTFRSRVFYSLRVLLGRT